MSTTRNKLIETTKNLLWENGYEATSPNQILESSGLGKGSLYHHFKGKKELAKVAIEERSEELIKEFNLEFDAALPLLDRFANYLCKDRDGLKGCRLGRLISDTSVMDDELREPIAKLFQHIEKNFTQALKEGIKNNQIKLNGCPEEVAVLLIAAIQGSFILSRAHNNPAYMQAAAKGAMQFLSTCKL